MPLRNYKLIIAYEGTRYKGWERQPGVSMTIQGKIESVLERMTEGAQKINVIAAGRTDAGVHARAMCANVHLQTSLDEAAILAYLNNYLPEDIAVLSVKEASERFHARFHASGKTYCYVCYHGASKPVFDRRFVTVIGKAPDVEAMRKAASYLTGTHDFKSFCLHAGTKKSTARTLDEIVITQKGGYTRLRFHGDGFLRGMVRILTGTLLEVGFQERQPEDMQSVLEAKSRRAAGPSAPPQGLTLLSVDYD